MFRKGVTIYLGVTGADLCPVAAIPSYMVRCSVMGRGRQSPFFCFSNGQALTRDNFVQELHVAISAGGIVASTYAGHSFWIGAATTRQCVVCLSHWLIKPLADGKARHTCSTYEPHNQPYAQWCGSWFRDRSQRDIASCDYKQQIRCRSVYRNYWYIHDTPSSICN